MLPLLFVRDNRRIFKFQFADVVLLQSNKNYTTFYVFEEGEIKTHFVRCTLTSAIAKLPPKFFVQINRSEVIGIQFIDEIEKDELKIGRNGFTISRQFYKSVIKKLDILGSSRGRVIDSPDQSNSRLLEL